MFAFRTIHRTGKDYYTDIKENEILNCFISDKLSLYFSRFFFFTSNNYTDLQQ